jgi:hypothetical protein
MANNNPIVSATPSLAFQSGRDRIMLNYVNWGYLGLTTGDSVQDPSRFASIFNTQSFAGLSLVGNSQVDRFWVYSPRSGINGLEISTDSPYLSEIPAPFMITAAPIETVSPTGGGANNLIENPLIPSKETIFNEQFQNLVAYTAPATWGPNLGSSIWQGSTLSIWAYLRKPPQNFAVRQPYVDNFTFVVATVTNDIYRVWNVLGRQTARLTFAADTATEFIITGAQGTDLPFDLTFASQIPAPPGNFPKLVGGASPVVTTLESTLEIGPFFDGMNVTDAVTTTIDVQNLTWLILRAATGVPGPLVVSASVRCVIDDE